MAGTKRSAVNHPPHYTAHRSGVECIEIAEHMNFNLGNAMKYIWRNEAKNGTEDLRKAIWYLEREIKLRERATVNFNRQQVADACRRHSVDVKPELILDYDAARLLWAFCGVESTFGKNCGPRYEAAYDKGGKYGDGPEMVALREKFGRLAACSFGPMQVLLVNAPKGYAPTDFDDLDKGMAAGVFALNVLLGRNHAKSLSEMGACYNAGHVPHDAWPMGVRAYAGNLVMHYAEPMPDPVEEPLKG